MKHLKLFESYTESEIFQICEKYLIRNWSINSEGLIDVDDDVHLYGMDLTKLPLSFGYVSGYFSCGGNKLTNLDGCPHTVGGNFSCAYNIITSLEGCPHTVGSDFYCYNNELTSLEGCLRSVVGNFNCANNKLTSLRFAPEEVDGGLYVLPNPISDIPKKYLNEKYLEFIVKEQTDWRLYRKDGTMRLDRLKEMIEWGIETKKIKPI
jgi:hypothetical protein